MERESERRVLVTGASRGIGLALVERHLARGDRVIATCRDPARATELRALAAAHADRCDVLALDVTDEGAIERAVEVTRTHVAALDVLWSNAGVYPGSPGTHVREGSIGTLTARDGLEILSVNTVGAILVAQAFLPLLRAGRAPRLAALSSGYGSVSENTGTPYWYGASKAALNMLHRSLAHDPAARDVIVLLLSPGWTQTDMGGPGAPDPLDDVVHGLVDVVDGARPSDTGEFFDWRGDRVPW
ncbi:SDR family oxidoreductase [Myxococcota bacterium]|nr:SDR family oxidoreductase [Myxococcota bacterium]